MSAAGTPVEINADAYPTTPAADAVFALVVTGGRLATDAPRDPVIPGDRR